MTNDKTVTLQRDCEALLVPQAAATTVEAGTRVRILQSVGDAHTVMTDRQQVLRIDAENSDALGLDPPAKRNPSPAAGTLFDQCMEELQNCYDPEFPVNIVDLGLVYVCQVSPLPEGGYEVLVLMTLTSPACGMGDILKIEVERKLANLPDVNRVKVEFLFDPPWDMERMTDAARLQLGLM